MLYGSCELVRWSLAAGQQPCLRPICANLEDIQLDTLDLERNRKSAISATASHDYGGGNSMPRGTSASPSRQWFTRQISPYNYNYS